MLPSHSNVLIRNAAPGLHGRYGHMFGNGLPIAFDRNLLAVQRTADQFCNFLHCFGDAKVLMES